MQKMSRFVDFYAEGVLEFSNMVICGKQNDVWGFFLSTFMHVHPLVSGHRGKYVECCALH